VLNEASSGNGTVAPSGKKISFWERFAHMPAQCADYFRSAAELLGRGMGPPLQISQKVCLHKLDIGNADIAGDRKNCKQHHAEEPDAHSQ
jgi:hypothetical protein